MSNETAAPLLGLAHVVAFFACAYLPFLIAVIRAHRGAAAWKVTTFMLCTIALGLLLLGAILGLLGMTFALLLAPVFWFFALITGLVARSTARSDFLQRQTIDAILQQREVHR